MTTADSVFDAARHLKFGPPVTVRNLTLIPLVGAGERDAEYRTLDDALAAGWIRVTEIDRQGSVPQLKVTNVGDTAVFLLDGEELVGAKQNRVLNLSGLVPAHHEIVVPVSCVEAGRWHHVSDSFSSSPRAQFAEGRAAKMRQVTRSMEADGRRASDQSAVWSLIAEKTQHLSASSATGAMSAAFEKVERPIDDIVGGFPPIERQSGAVFAIDGRVAGLECFDAPSTWRKLAPKLVRSYALDTLDPSGRRSLTAVEDASTWLARLTMTAATVLPAVGEGEDVRLSGPDLAGAALVARGRVIHLSAFPNA